MNKLAVVVLVLGGGLASADEAKPRATVSYGAPIVTGTYAAKVLTAAVKKSQTKYLACYNKALVATPDLEGTANATFTITAAGKVTNVAVSGLAGADTCIAGVIAKLKLAKPKNREAIEVTYPLSFTTMVPGGAFASITGTGDISSGFDDKNIYGGLLGDEAGEMTGGGGGGTGWGTIGTGRYGQIGQGSGTGSGYGMRGRASAVPSISIGQPTVVGDLDKAIIRRYIKRNAQKLLYCYEKELLAKSTLQGTVMADFTIGVDGKVAAASAVGVDAEVEACVARAIQGIEFPKPKGASEVKVQYPLTYRPPPKTEPVKK